MAEENGQMTAEQCGLVEDNIKLATWVVHHKLGNLVRNGWLSLDDAIGWANLALCEAAAVYDPVKGVAFSTFATHVIMNKVVEQATRYEKRHKNVASLDDAAVAAQVEAPDAIADELSKSVVRDVHDSTKYWLDGYNQKEIAERMGVTQSKVKQEIKEDKERIFKELHDEV